jgi:hypothetical protein
MTEPTKPTEDSPVSITIELTIDELTLGDCYPDGIPDGCTSEQLLATVQESRGVERFLRDWCLGDDAFVTVNVPGSPTAMGSFIRSITAKQETR